MHTVEACGPTASSSAALAGFLAAISSPVKQSARRAHTYLATGSAGQALPLDPADIVAAAGTAEADALAAAFDYSWLPGQGMQLALLQVHELTGLPWCEQDSVKPSPLRQVVLLFASVCLTSMLRLVRRPPPAQVGRHHCHHGRDTLAYIPRSAVGDEEHAEAVGARYARQALQ